MEEEPEQTITLTAKHHHLFIALLNIFFAREREERDNRHTERHLESTSSDSETIFPELVKWKRQEMRKEEELGREALLQPLKVVLKFC